MIAFAFAIRDFAGHHSFGEHFPQIINADIRSDMQSLQTQ